VLGKKGMEAQRRGGEGGEGGKCNRGQRRRTPTVHRLRLLLSVIRPNRRTEKTSKHGGKEASSHGKRQRGEGVVKTRRRETKLQL